MEYVENNLELKYFVNHPTMSFKSYKKLAFLA